MSYWFSWMDLNQIIRLLLLVQPTFLKRLIKRSYVQEDLINMSMFTYLISKDGKKFWNSTQKKIKTSTEVNTLVIAKGTAGFSGADLYNLVNTAALRASSLNKKFVSMKDLDYAKDKVMMGPERKSQIIPDDVKKLTAYHESGHALVAMNTKGAYQLHKATIIPRGNSLGMTQQLPDDRLSVSKQQLLANLDVCMGGRVAEELIFGPDHVTTGASSDLQQATYIASKMVMSYGMSDKLGYISIDSDNIQKLSPQTRQIIDDEIKNLLEGAHKRARALLENKQRDLHALAEALLKHETLSSKQIDQVIAGETLDIEE